MPVERLDARELARRAGKLTWVLLDVDGTLTDGRLYYGPDSLVLKAFDTRDGLGVKMIQWAGLKVGTLSGRADAAVERRAQELALDLVLAGHHDKAAAFQEFLGRHAVTPEAVAYAGDDLQDLAVMRRCGLALAPADADPEVRRQAHVVLGAPGGRGVVRELAELILRARGEWEGLTARFYADGGVG